MTKVQGGECVSFRYTSCSS